MELGYNWGTTRLPGVVPKPGEAKGIAMVTAILTLPHACTEFVVQKEPGVVNDRVESPLQTACLFWGVEVAASKHNVSTSPGVSHTPAWPGLLLSSTPSDLDSGLLSQADSLGELSQRCQCLSGRRWANNIVMERED